MASRYCSSSTILRNAFSMSADNPYFGIRNLRSMAVKSFKIGGPVVRQSFRLGCADDLRQLQSYTTSSGLVEDSVRDVMTISSDHICVLHLFNGALFNFSFSRLLANRCIIDLVRFSAILVFLGK